MVKYMNICVDALYSIKDQIYVTELYNGIFTPSSPLIVDKVHIHITSEEDFVTYSVLYGGLVKEFREDDCFGTYEDCLEFCESLNEEKRK